MTPEKPAERSRDVYRFEVTVPAGKSAQARRGRGAAAGRHLRLLGNDDQAVRVLPAEHGAESEAEGGAAKSYWACGEARRDAAGAGPGAGAAEGDHRRPDAAAGELREDAADVGGVQALPGKFDQQETEIEKLQAEIKAKQASAKTHTKEYEDFVATLNVEA